MRSKAYWGYPPEFLAACRSELSYSSAQIESPDWLFLVAEDRSIVIGFCALERVSAEEFELSALFVEPARIAQGIGRALLDQARCRAAELGGQVLRVQSDPHADGFYRAMGGQPTGLRESGSIPGRYLPTFAIFL